MSKYLTKNIKIDNKILVLTAIAHDGHIPVNFSEIVKNIFKDLVDVVRDDIQFLYIRDNNSYSIDNKYPGGNCFNRHEAMIALPNWDVDIQLIEAAIYHEMHHMARWQNIGYGDTLGGAIVSEGIATYYEELRSGWTPPWAEETVSSKIIKEALNNWDNTKYNHNEWFYELARGRWIGYSIGYKIAKELYRLGFELNDSVNIKPEDAKELLNL